MNIECRRKGFYRFLLIQKTERSDSILRNSAVRFSARPPAAKAAALNTETWIF
jgi:hypothetical protein